MHQLEAPHVENWLTLLDASVSKPVAYDNSKHLSQRLTGAFYTPDPVGRLMVRDLMQVMPDAPKKTLKIVDPFAGDGRLLKWFIEAFNETPKFAKWTLNVHAWDCSEIALQTAKLSLLKLRVSGRIEINFQLQDTFSHGSQQRGTFDLCITNPPWEVLKPDPKELSSLSKEEQETYVSLLKERANWLESQFPLARPMRKFSGWGVNLARVGAELSVNLLKPNGAYAIVLPASLFGDQISAPIRKMFFEECTPSLIRSFPAASRLFKGVDQDFVTVTGKFAKEENSLIRLVQHSDKDQSVEALRQTEFNPESIRDSEYSISLRRGSSLTSLISSISSLQSLEKLERKNGGVFKLGRELDETRIAERLTKIGANSFFKGRDITRFSILPPPNHFVRGEVKIPKTVDFEKLVWRDVSRQSSNRRMIATIVPAGVVTGNSLNVASAGTNTSIELRALLAIFNSLVFEAQIRSGIATNHVSVGAIRKFKVPENWSAGKLEPIAKLVNKMLVTPNMATQIEIDILVFNWFGLKNEDIEDLFQAMTIYDPKYIEEIRKATASLTEIKTLENISSIPSHIAPTLSALDILICESVPPGGNWKDIPSSVPSKRLETIRDSFARGEGSRSTYYGRLDPEKPSYTINTYFTRPGNGCHIHYDMSGHQHRTMSYREAARFQSFPDSFKFEGSKTSIATQIGNAVPPLLGFQIAKHLSCVGSFVDLFAGAGGLGLGFTWAGWQPITANEFDPAFAKTYVSNVHERMHVGDIRSPNIKNAIALDVESLPMRPKYLAVLGGPPCQGFSTAGKPRTMDDPRNWLFQDYCDVLASV